jgi:hypothetical protein
MYYHGAAGALIVYDVSREETFERVKSWVDGIIREREDKGNGALLIILRRFPRSFIPFPYIYKNKFSSNFLFANFNFAIFFSWIFF